MELCSLHPFDLDQVKQYVQTITDVAATAAIEPTVAQARRAYQQAFDGNDTGVNAISYGLAWQLATARPSFVASGFGLTIWEARVDRGVGMRVRPPSRLFIKAGLDPYVARMLPIRIDPTGGMMGGAFVPARLVADLEDYLTAKMGRMLRRLADAELDGVALLGLMLEACAYSREQGLGLYEAMDVVTPATATAPPSARIIIADRKGLPPDLRRTLLEMEKAQKPPGLMSRLLHHRPASRSGGNGPGPGRE